MQKFENRPQAGKILAEALGRYKGSPDTLVFALPRGGVPVAHEVAQALSLPLDICLVRKIGMPGYEEFAIGAVAAGGIRHINPDYEDLLPREETKQVMQKEEAELQRRNALYRQNRPFPDVTGKTVIIIDDGLATGATMRAAVEFMRGQKAGRVIAAVPVGSRAACNDLAYVADEVVCPYVPEPFWGVGQWYEDFSQTGDREVRQILERYR